MAAYKVGQVLFVVPTDSTIVVPVQVAEEVTKKTVHGSVTTYMITYRAQKEEKLIDLKQLKGELFETSAQARKILTERAVTAINRVVEQAVNLAQTRYPGSFENSSSETQGNVFEIKQLEGVQELETVPQQLEEENVITLPNGVQARARIVLPDSLKG